jgi:hypothetical protein
VTSDEVLRLLADLRKDLHSEVGRTKPASFRDRIIYLANLTEQLLPDCIQLRSEICIICSLAVLRHPDRALDRLETIVWQDYAPVYIAHMPPASQWIVACRETRPAYP